MNRVARYPVAVLTATDRWINTAVLMGDDRETVSGRAWFAEQDGKRWGRVLRPAIDWIFRHLGVEHHCELSAIYDAACRKVVAELTN